MRTGEEAAVWATGKNSFGVSVFVCAWESTSGGERERRQQRRFTPPGSRVYALVDRHTGYTHVVTLRWDRVELHEELARQSRVRIPRSQHRDEPCAVDWEGSWALDCQGVGHQMMSGPYYCANVRRFLSPVEIEIFLRGLEAETAAKATMRAVVKQAAAVAAEHTADRLVAAERADQAAWWAKVEALQKNVDNLQTPVIARESATPTASTGGARATTTAATTSSAVATAVNAAQQRAADTPEPPQQPVELDMEARTSSSSSSRSDDQGEVPLTVPGGPSLLVLVELDLTEPLVFFEGISGDDEENGSSNGSSGGSGDDSSSNGSSGGSGGDSNSNQPQGDPATEEAWKGVAAFPFDRGKRSPLSAGRGGEILGITHPFDRGKEIGDCSMKDGGLCAGG